MHSVDTAAVCKWLYSKLISRQIRERLENQISPLSPEATIVPLLGLLHDLGKMQSHMQQILCQSIENYDRFQIENCPIPIPKGASYRHDGCSEAILKKLGYDSSIASIVGSHHGKPQEAGYDVNPLILYDGVFFGNGNQEPWISLWKDWSCSCLMAAGLQRPEQIPKISADLQVVLSGLLVMADWIASDQSRFPLISVYSEKEEMMYPDRIKKGLENLNLAKLWESELYGADAEWFEASFGFVPRPMQEKTMEIVSQMSDPSLMIIEAEMGSGKTEAALAAAEVMSAQKGMGGIFFGLPTQATANGLLPRIRSWASGLSFDEQYSLILSHSKAGLNPVFSELIKDSCSDAGEEFKISPLLLKKKLNLLGNFVIGTIDTALMSCLEQRHFMLRHLGISSKTVILDEVHAYDAYMEVYLSSFLAWCGKYNIPVILLSATLPEERKKELLGSYYEGKYPHGRLRIKSLNQQYPLITALDGKELIQESVEDNHSRLTVKVQKMDLDFMNESTIYEIVNDLASGGCIGVILNTVGQVEDFAKKVKSLFPDQEVLVVHARFTDKDREAKEEKVLSRIGKAEPGKAEETYQKRNGLLIVGTQVLQESLDIDFDRVYTILAPVDILLQRIGRLFRHRINDQYRPNVFSEPVCCVFEAMGSELDQGTASVYSPWILQLTRNILPDQISIPHDIANLVQSVYHLAAHGQGKEWEEYRLNQSDKRRKAEVYCLKGPRTVVMGKSLDNLFKSKELDELQAEAAIRDGGSPLEVVLLRRAGDLEACDCTTGEVFRLDETPDKEEASEILKRKIRLPLSSEKYGAKYWQVLETLEQETMNLVPEWQKNRLLRGELLFLLNEDNTGEICGKQYRYSYEFGLET